MLCSVWCCFLSLFFSCVSSVWFDGIKKDVVCWIVLLIFAGGWLSLTKCDASVYTILEIKMVEIKQNPTSKHNRWKCSEDFNISGSFMRRGISNNNNNNNENTQSVKNSVRLMYSIRINRNQYFTHNSFSVRFFRRDAFVTVFFLWVNCARKYHIRVLSHKRIKTQIKGWAVAYRRKAAQLVR